jgi:hypothetical protein
MFARLACGLEMDLLEVGGTFTARAQARHEQSRLSTLKPRRSSFIHGLASTLRIA